MTAHIQLCGTPKSWQREMDCQGFDPLTRTQTQAVAFMEWVETSAEFDQNKKTNKVATSKAKKKSSSSNGSQELHHCVLHGNMTPLSVKHFKHKQRS